MRRETAVEGGRGVGVLDCGPRRARVYARAHASRTHARAAGSISEMPQRTLAEAIEC